MQTTFWILAQTGPMFRHRVSWRGRNRFLSKSREKSRENEIGRSLAEIQLFFKVTFHLQCFIIAESVLHLILQNAKQLRMQKKSEDMQEQNDDCSTLWSQYKHYTFMFWVFLLVE